MAVPKIRFPEFSGEWEEKNLGDIVTEDENPVDTPTDGYTRLGIRSHHKGTFHEYVEPGEQLETAKMFVASSHHLIFNITFAWEEAWAITQDDDAGKLVSHRFPQYAFNDGQYDRFYQYRLMNNEFKYALGLASPGGAGRNRVLNKTELMKISINVPTSLEEQTRVGDLFDQLENEIAQHQQKLDDLKKLKQALLQKMLPAEGEKTPEIRFPGFTDPWRQRMLGDICAEITVGIANSATQAYSHEGVVMFRNQNIKENYLDDSDLVHITPEFERRYVNKRLKKNDLLIARTGYPGTACVVPEKYENAQTFTTLIARLKGDINPYYTCQYINSPQGKSYVLSTQIGGGQKNSGAGILQQMPIMIPATENEQIKIASFLGKLDYIVTLHQRKLDALKQLQNALLQQMFV